MNSTNKTNRMKNNIEQSDDKRNMLLKITADLFLQNVAKRFKIAIQTHPGGFIFDIINLRLKSNFSSELYLVGQHKHGQKFEAGPNLNELLAWLRTNLVAIYRLGGFIGGWWNKDGKFFLDVVAAVPGYENAMLAGRMNGEKEIYHPYGKRSIKVDKLQTD